MNNVLIVGWYGTETLGDKAILGGIVQTLRELNPAVIVDVCSLEPYITEFTSQQMPELKINRVLSVDNSFTQIKNKRYDCIILGGGPLMTSIKEIFLIWELFKEGEKNKTKAIIFGCGIGPLNEKQRRKVIREILNISDLILLRDSNSKVLAEKVLKIKKEIRVILDPAFFYLKKVRKIIKAKKDTDKGKVINLALRDWPIDEYSSDISNIESQNIKKNFETEIINFMKYLRREHVNKVIPFCMHKLAVGGDDRIFYRRILKTLPEVLNNMNNIHTSPQEDIVDLQESDFLLAMRYHSLVFALTLKIPFLVVDYTKGGKIKGLLNDLFAEGEIENLLIRIENFTSDKAIDLFNKNIYSEMEINIDEKILLSQEIAKQNLISI